MAEETLKYLDNPQKYCEKISSLLAQNSKEWITVWKAAIPEMSSVQCKEISKINALLKPVEAAFKSKDSNLRVQAFECWSYFVTDCEMLKESDKLLNVVLIPLLAHNHSVYIVLSAKLKTWHTLVDTSYITKENIMKKAIPSLLRCMYGPHTLELACNFAALSESCGQLYHKILTKCAQFDEQLDFILSYLEKAIPPLSNMENTQKIAKLIWSDALRIISEKEWPKHFFAYLMRTFENLISDEKNDGFQLISNFLSILVNIYGSFPPDRLTPHVNLAIRCLFHPPINTNVITNIMSSLLKLCEDPSFFFHQLDIVLISTAESKKNDLDKLWIAVAACYKKWLRHNRVNDGESLNHDYTTACRILLFPFNHLNELSDDTERFHPIMKQWKSCYEDCASSADCDKFLKTLAEGIEFGIESTFKKDLNMRISAMKVGILFCNAILTMMKFSDGFPHLKSVLLKISEYMPQLRKLSESNSKSFVVKYVVTVLSYVKLFPACSDDFSYVIKTFNHLVPSDTEQVVPKLPTEKGDDINVDSVSNIPNNVSKPGSVTTPVGKLKLRTSFLERLSPVNKKSDVVESLVRSPSTPKISKISDDDVEFIAIQPKPKPVNSPMTEHQREMAKAKRHIPALYQDLSQSQSQSQCESISLLSGNKKPNDKIQPELFEENANLPAADMGTDKDDLVPGTLSFRSGLDALTKSDKSASTFLSKKSLFNDAKNSSDAEDIPLASAKLTNKDNSENLPPVEEIVLDGDDKPAVKRRQSKATENASEVTPVKRSKRLSGKVENAIITRSGRKSIAANSTPQRGDLRKRRSNLKPHDEPTGKPEADEGVEIINLTDSESQNVFVPTSGSKRDKIVNVSSPLNSLMNVKNDDQGGKTRRKSLRTRKNSLPSRSPISTRKRASVGDVNVFNSKKSLFPDNSSDEGKSESTDDDGKKDAQPSNKITEPSLPKKLKLDKRDDNDTNAAQVATCSDHPMETDDKIANKENDDNQEKTVTSKTSVVSETSSDESVITCVAVNVKPDDKSPPDDSVIFVEEVTREVISIADSDCQIDEKQKSPLKKPPLVAQSKILIKEDVSDESTFFEGSEDASKNPSKIERAENATANDENNAVERSPKSVPINVIRSTVNETNAVENINGSGSPEIVKSVDIGSGDKDAIDPAHMTNDCVQPITEENADNKIDSATGSVSILENASASASNESVSILDTSSSAKEVSDDIEHVIIDDSPTRSDENKDKQEDPISVADSDKNENPAENKVNESDADTNSSAVTEKDETADKGGGNTSPIHSNSRASQMIKLVSGSNVSGRSPNQVKTYSKRDRPRLPNGRSKSQYLKTPSQRSSRMMKSLSFDNDQNLSNTPNKIITTPITEKLKYPPKECTSPGILKKPDANQNNSPKSPKIVNFADKLTDTREFYKDEEIDEDSLISTGDKLSNDNLINCEDIQSQDVLYPPLQNCRDEIKDIIEYIFNSAWNQQALEHFQQIGINTVGQLASMSTLSASSIPAGDNRIQRLKNALKKYDEKISSMYENKGLRRPSVRRRISKSFECENIRRIEVSCIIDLLSEEEPSENDIAVEEGEEMKNDIHCPEVTVEKIEVEPKPTSPEKLSIADATAANETEEVYVMDGEKTSRAKPNITLQLLETNDKQVSVVLSRLTVAEINARSMEDVAIEREDGNVAKSMESGEKEEMVMVDGSAEVTEQIAQAEPEAMEVDKESRNETPTSNETANDSTDYVCTSNDNENGSNSTEKRNLTIKNIRRYSTVIESRNDGGVVPAAAAAAKSPEIISVDTDDEIGPNESVSIFVREEVPREENSPVQLIPVSPSIISSGDIVDSDIGSETVVEKSTADDGELKTPLSENCSVDEIPATVDQSVSPCPVPRNDELPVQSVPRGSWKKAMLEICQFYTGTEEEAKASVFQMIERVGEALGPDHIREISDFISSHFLA